MKLLSVLLLLLSLPALLCVLHRDDPAAGVAPAASVVPVAASGAALKLAPHTPAVSTSSR